MNAAPGGTRLGLLPALLRTCLRRVHTRPSRRPPPKGFQGPEGHGEHIWVFVHRRTEQVIFSFKDRLDVGPRPSFGQRKPGEALLTLPN